jgi:hypothetical protein
LTLIKVRVRQLAADLFDDLDVLQVCRALPELSVTDVRTGIAGSDLEAKNGIHSEICEVIFVLRQNLGRKGGSGDVEEILPESLRI